MENTISALFFQNVQARADSFALDDCYFELQDSTDKLLSFISKVQEYSQTDHWRHLYSQ